MLVTIRGAIIGVLISGVSPMASVREGTAGPVSGRACSAIQIACLPWQAPIGHRQPAVTDISKVQPSPSDLELRALDRAIDEKLTICRGC